MQITKLDAPRCGVGEGALWDVASQALWFTSIMEGKLHRHDPATGETRSWQTGGHIGALALDRQGRAVLGTKDRVVTFDPATGATTPVAGPLWDDPAVTINEGAVDAMGRFLLGGCAAGIDAPPQPIGGLFRATAAGTAEQLDSGIHQSNCHCFSPDGRTLYAGDSFTDTLFAYDYDPATGEIGPRRPFVVTTDLGGCPDGSVCDAEGRVWVSIFKGGKVAAFNSDGTLHRTVALPTRLIASCAFGGPALDRLYVTTIAPAVFGWGEDEAGGHTYVVEGLGVTGTAQPRFG